MESNLHIGFDAKRVVNNPTGLGNYGRTLIDGLSAVDGLRLSLYSPVSGNPKLVGRLQHPDRLETILPEGHPGRISRDLWRMHGVVGELRRDHVDLYHGLTGELPRGLRKAGIPAVVTIHDLIFLRHPEWYKPWDVMIYKWKFHQTLKEATRIVAISELTRQDILHYGQFPEDRIDVIYQDCDESFKHAAPEELKAEARREYELPGKYILNVGSIEARKNVALAVKALTQLPADVHLVIVGKETRYEQEVRRTAIDLGLEARVHIRHDVTFRLLPAVYQQAAAFVYPSRYEGFGIPILEAANSLVPIVAGTCGCLREAGGEACLYVDPDDSDAMAAALQQLLQADNRERCRQTREYVQRFNNAAAVSQMLQTYRRSLQ